MLSGRHDTMHSFTPTLLHSFESVGRSINRVYGGPHHRGPPPLWSPRRAPQDLPLAGTRLPLLLTAP